jgi:hypothetical protein
LLVVRRARRPAPIVCGPLTDAVASDVARLPEERRLVSSGVYDVFCAPARELPTVLHEIGRLRELTFRAVGEGTGRSTDLGGSSSTMSTCSTSIRSSARYSTG